MNPELDAAARLMTGHVTAVKADASNLNDLTESQHEPTRMVISRNCTTDLTCEFLRGECSRPDCNCASNIASHL